MSLIRYPGLLSVIALSCIAGKTLANDAVDGNECRFDAAEKRMVELLLDHPGQQRDEVTCDPGLNEFARFRAKDMADRDYFGHVNPERKGPNAILRETGYEMPKYYVGGIANSIESILGGEGDVDKALRLLLESGVHRRHLLGEGETYLKQDRFGLAYLRQPDSKFAHYWVIVFVEHGKEDRAMTCTPAPPVCIVH